MSTIDFAVGLHTKNTRKPDKATATTGPQKASTFDPSVLKDQPALSKDDNGGAEAERPSSSHSHKMRKRLTDLPFGFDTALNALGLPSPHKFVDSSYPSLRGPSSNPNLGSNWGNGSTPNLVLSTRPGTSSRDEVQFDSAEMPVTRTASPVSISSPISSISVTSRSPLGQFELAQNVSDEGASVGALRPPGSLRARISPATENVENQGSNPAGKPPSPPQSIRTDEVSQGAVPAGATNTSRTDADERSSADSQRAVSADLDKEFRELTEELDYGARSIPSPPASVHRGGSNNNNNNNNNDELLKSAALFEEWGPPIIRTVEAKRNTPTITFERRMSVETRIERHGAPPSPSAPGSADSATFPAPEPPAKSSARAGARPPALNLSLRPAPADLDGPRSAPFPVNRSPWVPLGQSPLAPGRVAPALSRLVSSLHVPADSLDFDASQSPESPVLPLSGPLANIGASLGMRSPLPGGGGGGGGVVVVGGVVGGGAVRRGLVRRSTEPAEEDPEERMRNFRFPNVAPAGFPTFGHDDDDETMSPYSPAAEPFPTFAPPKRVVTTPANMSNWPLPLPKSATVSSVLGAGAGASARPELEPLELPRMPAALAESTTVRTRSFSRPWTPSNEPLKFEITTPTSATATAAPPLRARTTTASTTHTTSSASSSRRGQSPRTTRPPPRSPPSAAVVDRGLRSPGIVGDDFGGGFI